MSRADHLEGEHTPHKPADDREEVYFQGSPLLRGDLGRVILFAVIAAILIAVPFLARRYGWFEVTWWMWLVAAVLAILCLVVPMFVVRMTKYRVSNYRIDYERGILSKNIDTLELWHVEDIKFHQSILDRILNVGNITVLSHDDTTPELVLRGVPNARALFDNLKQRIIAVKRQRGVLKIDGGGGDLNG